MKKNTILFLSVLSMIMILNLPKVKADDIPDDYYYRVKWDFIGNETFMNIYNSRIEPYIEDFKASCETRYNTDKIMIVFSAKGNSYSSKNDALYCVDVSNSENVEFFIETYSSKYDYKLKNLTNVKSRGYYLPSLSGAYYFENDNQTSIPFITYSNFIDYGNLTTFEVVPIPIYSAIPVTFTSDDERTRFSINGNEIKQGEEFYLNYDYVPVQEKIDLTSTCVVYGECYSDDIEATVTFDEGQYLFTVTNQSGTVLKRYEGSPGTAIKLKWNQIFYNDDVLTFTLKKFNEEAQEYEIAIEKTYTIDTASDEADIIFTEDSGRGDDNIYINIGYLINDPNNDHIYQYRLDGKAWHTLQENKVIVIVETYVEARILDKNGKIIISETYYRPTTDAYFEYEEKALNDTLKFKATIRNVSDGLTCKYRVFPTGKQESAYDWVDCGTLSDGMVVYENTFSSNYTFHVQLFNSNNQIVLNNTKYIDTSLYKFVSNDFKSNISNFFTGFKDIIDEISDLIQYGFDGLKNEIKLVIVALYSLFLLIITIKLVR